MSNGVQSQTKSLWMVNPYALPPSIPGGTRHYETSLLLKEYGWQSRIVATPYNYNTHTFDRPVTLRSPHLDRVEDGVDFTWVYTMPYTANDIRRYANMASFLLTSQIRAKGRNRPDVVLGSTPHLLSALSGWFMAKRYRVPFLLEVRDLWPESLVQLGLTNPVIIKPLEMLEKFLYRQADAIICLTDGIATSIRERIADPGKVSVLPNGVLKPEIPDADIRRSIRAKLGWGENDVIAIYAGAHGDANDLGQIVEAARSLNDAENIRFVLFGDGPTKSEVQAQAEGLSNIDFQNAVSKSEIVDVLRAADIGILTLKPVPLFEGARPNKLFDYMGAGLPIISTVRGEAETVLAKSGAGVGVSPDGLANAVQEFANNPSKRNSMGSAGFKYMSEGETREVVTARLSGILDSLIEKSPSSQLEKEHA